MSTLILVTSDTGAGHLKQEKRADRVQWFTHRLVSGPVPVDGPPETFFERQRARCEVDGLFHEPYWFERENLDGSKPEFKPIWSRLPDVCREHDRIELWIDPDPNAQLVMVQLLDWLGRLPDIVSRLWLKLSDSPLGQRQAGDWVLPLRPVEAADLALARRAWAAFGAPTPEPWAALRADPDLDRLPGLHQAIEHTLCELPDATGLGATSRRILALAEKEEWRAEVVQRGQDVPEPVLPDGALTLHRLLQRVQSGKRLPLYHFEVGELVCQLAAAPDPALSGITETHFTLEAHLDPERHRRLHESSIRLTDLGHRLVAGTADWSSRNPVHRWLGGTRLVNDRLWRWNQAARQPLAPQPPSMTS